MLNIQPLTASDLAQVARIHEKHYQHEFSMDEFNRQFLGLFSITDSDGTVITAGGLRPLLESVIVTNKDASARKRREGLLKMLEINEFVAKRVGNNSFHAFIQD